MRKALFCSHVIMPAGCFRHAQSLLFRTRGKRFSRRQRIPSRVLASANREQQRRVAHKGADERRGIGKIKVLHFRIADLGTVKVKVQFRVVALDWRLNRRNVDVALALADGLVSVPSRQNEQTVLLEDLWTRLARVLLA